MKFVLEALGLTAGGGKELALNLFSRLARFDRHEFLLVLPDLAEYAGLEGANVRCRYHPRTRNLFERGWWLESLVPRAAADHGADALLCMGNFAPRRSPCPVAVLVHMPYLAYREPAAEARLTWREKLINIYGKLSLRRLRRRLRVIVQTATMRDRIVSTYDIDPGRITIIPNASDVSPADGDGNLPSPAERKRDFTFLCLTRYYAHKNLEILPEALKELRALTSKPARCLITISPDQHPGARKLLERLEREQDSSAIVNIGPVPSSRLAEVYRSADALILPTLLESFTRTYSEAMHFHLPILTSDRDFARALCRDAALYFDPLDARSVARCMGQVLEDAQLRQRLLSNARRVLHESPAWDEIAAQFVGALERTAREAEPQAAFDAEPCLKSSQL